MPRGDEVVEHDRAARRQPSLLWVEGRAAAGFFAFAAAVHDEQVEGPVGSKRGPIAVNHGHLRATDEEVGAGFGPDGRSTYAETVWTAIVFETHSWSDENDRDVAPGGCRAGSPRAVGASHGSLESGNETT